MGSGSSKSSRIVKRTRVPPGTRGAGGSHGAKRTAGLPARAMTISSPAMARSTNRDKCVFASCMLTICATPPHLRLCLVKRHRSTSEAPQQIRARSPAGSGTGRARLAPPSHAETPGAEGRAAPVPPMLPSQARSADSRTATWRRLEGSTSTIGGKSNPCQREKWILQQLDQSLLDRVGAVLGQAPVGGVVRQPGSSLRRGASRGRYRTQDRRSDGCNRQKHFRGGGGRASNGQAKPRCRYDGSPMLFRMRLASACCFDGRDTTTSSVPPATAG